MELETTQQQGIAFHAEYRVKTLRQLGMYIEAHTTLPPIEAEDLHAMHTGAQSPDFGTDDDIPGAVEFTEAEAAFYAGIIEYTKTLPKFLARRQTRPIRLFTSRRGFPGTFVEIDFPAHMEPPAELR